MGGIGLELVTQLVEMTLLGTGFGDRFKVLQGDSRRFEEGGGRH
jgi:hypothetical protein